MDKKKLLEQRKAQKKKKPNFVMQDAHKKARLSRKWRRPRGLQSKMRLNKKGYNRAVKNGYGSPNAVRGLHPSGMESVIINTVKELDAIDPKTQGATIASTVGKRKRVEIIKKAEEKKIPLLNMKDPKGFIKKVEEALSGKKKARDERKQKQKKAASKKEESKKDSKKEEKGSKDEKEDKEQQKKEQDKVLTTKA